MENEPPAKKSKTEGDEGKSVNSEKELKKNILDDINNCQAEIEKLSEKASSEILEVEQKYNLLRKPIFKKRNEHFKKIPKFWVVAMSQHPHLALIIQEEEKDCLSYIDDCVAEEFDDLRLGYKISFFFKENPYFENSVLTKTLHRSTSYNAKSESTPIKWNEGKDLIKKCNANLQHQNHGRRKRTPTSFFSWFSDNSNAASDDIAETIKDDFWPSALQYYLAPDMEDDEYGDSAIEGEEEDVAESSDDEHDSINKMVGADYDSIAEAELEGQLVDEDSEEYTSESGEEKGVDEKNSEEENNKEATTEKSAHQPSQE